MAVTVDSLGGNSYNNSMGYTQTWSHTVNSGSNLLLLVSLTWYNVSGTISGVTFGADTLTEYTGGGTNSGSTAVRIFYKINPTVQTATITVTATTTGGAISYASASFFGAHQTTPLYNENNYAAPSGTLPRSVQITTNSGDMAIDLCEGGATVLAVFGSGTEILNTWNTAGETGASQYLAAVGNPTLCQWTPDSGNMNPDSFSFGVAIQQAAGTLTVAQEAPAIQSALASGIITPVNALRT